MAKKKYDFAGWATKANMKCTDSRTIMTGAFKDDDGRRVPLIWNHRHDVPDNVLGHADLEYTNDGVMAYCSFNDSDNARKAKALVEHGDITSLFIHANGLVQEMVDLHAVPLCCFPAAYAIFDVLKTIHALSSVKQIGEAAFAPLCLFYVRIRKKQADGMTSSFQKT